MPPSIKVKLEWKMTNLAKLPDNVGFKITYDTPEGEKVITSATVVLTAPAYVVSGCVKAWPRYTFSL